MPVLSEFGNSIHVLTTSDDEVELLSARDNKAAQSLSSRDLWDA